MTASRRGTLEMGGHYEITHGPASAPERTERVVVERYEADSNTYTFRADDGRRFSLVDDEIDDARRLD